MNTINQTKPRASLFSLCLILIFSQHVTAGETSKDLIPSPLTKDTLPWVNVPSDYSPYFETCTDIDDGTGHFKAGVFNVVQIQEGMRDDYIVTGTWSGDVNHKNYYHTGAATFGVHYADWSAWDKSNDPSMSGVTSSGWTISTTTPITNVVSP